MPLFSPDRPRRAGTRLVPCSVLASLSASRYRVCASPLLHRGLAGRPLWSSSIIRSCGPWRAHQWNAGMATECSAACQPRRPTGWL